MDILDLLLTHPGITCALLVTGAASWLTITTCLATAAYSALSRVWRGARRPRQPIQDVHLPGDAPGARAYAQQTARREDEL